MKQAVLIMVDTQRQDMLSCYDADAAPTPVLDALAREGMQFTNGYTCQPVCRAPDNKAVVSLPAFLAGQLLPQNLFSVFVLLDFLLAVLNLGGQFLAGFLSRFRHSWSLLSACRHRKRTVDFLGCPLWVSIKVIFLGLRQPFRHRHQYIARLELN